MPTTTITSSITAVVQSCPRNRVASLVTLMVVLPLLCPAQGCVAPEPVSRLGQAKPAGGPPLERLKKSSGWLYGKAIDQGWLFTLIGSDVGFAER